MRYALLLLVLPLACGHARAQGWSSETAWQMPPDTELDQHDDDRDAYVYVGDDEAQAIPTSDGDFVGNASPIRLVQGTMQAPQAIPPTLGASGMPQESDDGLGTSPLNSFPNTYGGGNPYSGENPYASGNTLEPFNDDSFSNSTYAQSQPRRSLPSRQVLPMVGDLFGGTNELRLDFDGQILGLISRSQFVSTNFGMLLGTNNNPGETEIALPVPRSGSTVGQLKVTENMTPVPTDRIFMNASNFYDVPFTPSGVNLTRFTPGFERTFADRLMSFEARFPFAITLSNRIGFEANEDFDSVELGDFQFGWKALLLTCRSYALSGGVFMSVPTGSDLSVSLAATGIVSPDPSIPERTELLSIENESIYVKPYIGFVSRASPDLSFQGYVQGDFNVRGDPVRSLQIIEQETQGISTRTVNAGRIKDATFLYLDLASTYYMYRSSVGTYRGIAPTLEFHWAHRFDNARAAQTNIFEFQPSDGSNPIGAPLTIGEATGSDDLVNMLVGSHFLVGDHDTFTFGYAAPITGGNNRQFDGELRLIYNRFW